ncbi:MAG: IS1096 element passenger TnpR family protein, partial [Actinomycetes bacterium]
SGGPWGYAEMLVAVHDQEHPDHETFAEWLDDDFDPEAFDVVAVNEVLRMIR